jgi:hypothetical protein
MGLAKTLNPGLRPRGVRRRQLDCRNAKRNTLVQLQVQNLKVHAAGVDDVNLDAVTLRRRGEARACVRQRLNTRATHHVFPLSVVSRHYRWVRTVKMSRSPAVAKQSLTRSTASDWLKGVAPLCTRSPRRVGSARMTNELARANLPHDV